MRSSSVSVRSTSLPLTVVRSAWCATMTANASSLNLNVKCVLPMLTYHLLTSLSWHTVYKICVPRALHGISVVGQRPYVIKVLSDNI